jgi:hypothetical protein
MYYQLNELKPGDRITVYMRGNHVVSNIIFVSYSGAESLLSATDRGYQFFIDTRSIVMFQLNKLPD